MTDLEATDEYGIISLRSLIVINLTAFRDKDRTDLRDLIDTGLVDKT